MEPHKLMIFPMPRGYDVLTWRVPDGRNMRMRHFADLAEMALMIQELRLITPQEADDLEEEDFQAAYPCLSCDVEDQILQDYGFRSVS